MLKKILTFFALGSLSLNLLSAEDSITKCQDLDGRWIYGEHPSERCASEISSFRLTGTPIQEAEVLDSAQPEKPSEQAQLQQAKDKSITRRYSSQEAIEQERNRKLTEIDRQIKGINTIMLGQSDDIDELKSRAPDDQTQAQIQARELNLSRYAKQKAGLIETKAELAAQYAQMQASYLAAINRLAIKPQ